MTKHEVLHNNFKKFGSLTLQYRRKCIGMLPEIPKLHIYEKKDYTSIYEYAAKLAGISRLQVDTVLRLERKFENKPKLKEALVTEEVSHHKLARVASIATTENDQELAEKAKILTKNALEVFAKDEKQMGYNKTKIGQNSLPGQTLELDEDVEKDLAELQQRGININNELRTFLKQRQESIAKEKQKLSSEANKTGPTKSRYIKIGVKKLLYKEYGKQCSKPSCQKTAEHIHHAKKFSIHHTHDPKHLKPLCKAHHELEHHNDKYFLRARQLATTIL